jgi:putative membrane protein
MALHVSQADVKAVETQIRDEETHTSGEIVVVLASQCDDYIHVPIHIATACALAMPLSMPILRHVFPWSSVPWGWVFMAQLVVFILVAAILSLDRLRWLVTPRALKRKYASRFAAAEFLALDLHRTEQRSGVLIFVALREHYIEIVADKSASELIDNASWQRVVGKMIPLLRAGLLTEALVQGVRETGIVLAQVLPPLPRNQNEVPDRVIVVDDNGTRVSRPGGNWDWDD